MNAERWQEIVSQIEENFQVEDKGRLQDEDNEAVETEFIVFTGPVGRLKLEFTTRPLILDRKTHYSNRIGSEVKVENIYSDTETSHSFDVWRWDEAADDWTPFRADLFQ